MNQTKETYYTKYCEGCGAKTFSFSPGEYGWINGTCDNCSIAEKLADELTHPDQELTLDELESDMSTHIEMAGYVDEQIGADGIDEDEVQDIIDRAFEIARAKSKCRACESAELEIVDGALACLSCDTWQPIELQKIRGDVTSYKSN